MVWSKWKTALLVIGVCTGVAGVAWSQQQTPSKNAPQMVAVKYVTIHENGKAIKCQHLEMRHTPGGRTIHRVRAVTTGEEYELEETNIVVQQKQPPQPRRIVRPAPTPVSLPPAPPCATEKPKARGLLVRLFGKRKSLSGSCATGACPVGCGDCAAAPDGVCSSCQPGLMGESLSLPPSMTQCPVCPDMPGVPISPIPQRHPTAPIVQHMPPTTSYPPVSIHQNSTNPNPSVSPYAPNSGIGAEPKPSAYPVVADQNPSAYPVITQPGKSPAPYVSPVATKPTRKKRPTAYMPGVVHPKPNLPQRKPAVATEKRPAYAVMKPKTPTPAQFPVAAPKKPSQTVAKAEPTRKTLRERIQWTFRNRPTKTSVKDQSQNKPTAKPFNTAIAQESGYPKKHVVLNPAKKSKTPQKPTTVVAKAPQKKETLPTVPFNPNWRKMWGQSSNPTAKPPGQSLVETAKLPPVSATVNGKSSDPLLDPTKAAREDIKKKFGVDGHPTLPQLPVGQPTVQAAPQYVPVSYPEGQQPYGNQIPMGVQSVIAAHNGMQGKTTFIPVPVVTVPNPLRPPTPPYPKVPDAPQLNKFVNAFTPPPSQNPQAQQGMNAQGQPMLPNQHPNMAGHPGMRYPQNPYMRPNMPPQMTPQQSYGRYPVANVNYPRQYPGPRPPQPITDDWNTPRPVMPAQYRPMPQQLPNGYAQQMPNGYPQQMPQQSVSMAQAQTQAMYQHQQLLEILQNSAFPSQREVAAQNLSRFDWRQNPHVLHGLLTAAKTDPSATVRAGCVHCMNKMDVDTPQFRDVLNTLQNDEDPRVRHEVGLARTRLGAATTPNGQPGVQHVGAMQN